MELIAQGAEAKLYKINETTLKKVREEKPYRIQILDSKLRKARNKREFKVLTKLSENHFLSPKPFELNETSTGHKNEQSEVSREEIYFTFEYINGTPLKDTLNETLLNKAFDNIIQLHQLDITHGDLTTLNMIVKDNDVYLIDFGLSEFTNKIEDKAVDLNLFFNCIKNEHPEFFKQKNKLLEKYSKDLEKGKQIISRLEQIEHRGRNK